MIWIPKPLIMLKQTEVCQTRIKIARKVRQRAVELTEVPDLSCMCGIASTGLAFAFENAGFPAKVVYGTFNYDNHCWVVSDEIIYDITATQFGNYRKVHVELVDSGKYNPMKKIDSLDWKKVESFFKSWPGCQTPNQSDVERMGTPIKTA